MLSLRRHFPAAIAPSLYGAALLLLASIAAAPALGALCGDDVEGVDVPCACGDTLTSSIVLGDDPVAQGECPRDGLVVFAPQASQPLTIDFAGHTIRGRRQGVGVRVVNAGAAAAAIVSSRGTGRIEGFRDGVVALTPSAIGRVENLQISGCGRDGLRVNGVGTSIRLVEVTGCGRDGISLRGSDWELGDSRAAENGRFGIVVNGFGGRLGAPRGGLTAESNRSAGFQLLGSGHRLSGSYAAGNGGDGIHLNAMRCEVMDCAASQNSGFGIGGGAGESRILRNRLSENRRGNIGIVGRYVYEPAPPSRGCAEDQSCPE